MTENLSRSLRDGRGAVVLAAIWNVFDALAHVAVDQVEPLRISGNLTVLAATALVWVALRRPSGARLAAAICGIAAALVLGFNLAWVAVEGELPIPAAIFILVSVGLLVWAASRFLIEARQPKDGQPA